MNAKVERKQKKNNNKESNWNPHEILQHEEENEDSNDENINDKMVIPCVVHFKTETNKGETNRNKKQYQVKMKKNKKVKNDSAMIKETNIKDMVDNFKKGPEELDLATDHVTCEKSVSPDIVKAFNHHAKIKAIIIESKLRLDVEKV